MSARQVPNLITLSRLVLAVVAFWYLHRMLGAQGSAEELRSHAAVAFWFFLVASITDFLDGFLARRYGWVTALGRIADPVVDKVLTLGGMMFLAAMPFLTREDDFGLVMPVWAVVLMLAREFLVTAIRGLVESQNMEFPADRFGKLKMTLQTIYVCIILGSAGGVPAALHLPFLDWLRDPLLVAVLFWLMVGMAAFSGLNYSRRAARMLSGVEW